MIMHNAWPHDGVDWKRIKRVTGWDKDKYAKEKSRKTDSLTLNLFE